MRPGITLALMGYGHVGRALARLVARRRGEYPFLVTGIHTARHGTALAPEGLAAEPVFGPAAASAEAFLDAAEAAVLVELTPLNPATGEPARSHMRAAYARRMHVVTANKGPIAHAYAALRAEARQAGVELRFESTVMDGAPVFNLVRHCLPAVRVQGFTGVLNSTSTVVVEALAQGATFQDGVEAARRLGIAEADVSFDIDGWDSAAKTAALANVLMDAHTTPDAVSTRGIGRLTPERVRSLAAAGKTVRLVSRARRGTSGVTLRVRAEVLEKSDLLAATPGTSNLLLLHTDLMGTIGTISLAPTVEQTAYGVFSDLVDLWRSL